MLGCDLESGDAQFYAEHVALSLRVFLGYIPGALGLFACAFVSL